MAGASFTWLLLGVVGVLGGAGDLRLFFGDAFDGAEVLAVEIGAGFEVVLVLAAAGFSTGFVTGGFGLPFVYAPSTFSSGLLAAGFAIPFVPSIFFCVDWVLSTGDSTIVSSANELRFLPPASGLIPCLLSGRSFGVSSSKLKLLLRFDVLDSRLRSLWKPICPFLSTVTKLVRTFDSGRGEVPVLAPP